MVSADEPSSSKCPNCERLEARVAELEAQVRELMARLKQNSSNSSRPPSSDPPWIRRPTAKPSGRKPGGQPGHPGAFRQRLPPERVAVIVDHLPERCECCHFRLPSDSKKSGEPAWHQLAELPSPAALVTEHRAHTLICPRCHGSTTGEIPAEIRARSFGPRLTAFMSYLTSRFHQSRRQVQELIQTVFHIPISLGAICAYEKTMSAALQPGYAEALDAVREAPRRNVDETGWNAAGKLCWLWAAGHASAAVFKIDPSRGKPGFHALLPKPKGIVITDRWHAYSQIPLRSRQLCWAHLKRDFQKLVDFEGGAEQTGHAGLQLVAEVFATWRQFKTAGLTRRELQRRMEQLQIRMRRTLEAARDGKVKRAARFSKRILKSFTALWTFVKVRGVEPTNNHAERLLRQAVLWRKNCQRSWSEDGCRFVERALSVVQTLRLQHRPVLEYLENALSAFYTSRQPRPLLL